MKNLKEKVLNIFNGSNNIEDTVNEVNNYQKKLAQNITNPLFSDNTKNKMLKMCSDLHNLEKCLYRYNIAQKYNNLSDVQEEKANVEDIILKGGISNVRYIWRAENSKKTCDECSSLDGQEFDLYDDIPAIPHPNCKCYIEIVEDVCDTNNNEQQEEPCNLLEEIDELIYKMKNAQAEINVHLEDLKSDMQDLENDVRRVNKLIQDNNSTLEILSKNYERHIPECENNVDAEYEQANYKKITLKILLDDVKQLLLMGKEGIGTFVIFSLNYLALLRSAYILKQHEMDKYYHSKANCEAVQKFGQLGEEAAILLSNTKEKFDQWHNVYAKSHKVTIEEAIADSERDQIANRLGRKRGRKYPNCKCSELMSDLKTKHHNN